MPQLGTLLSASQPGPQVSQQASPQPATRVVAHSAATGSLPQVRVVTAQPGLPTSSASQTATLVHQSPHHIRVPVTVAHGKNITQVHYSISSNNVCVFSVLLQTDNAWITFLFVFLWTGSGDSTTKKPVCRKSHSGAGFTGSGQSYCSRSCICCHSYQTSDELPCQSGTQPNITCCIAGCQQPEYYQTGTNWLRMHQTLFTHGINWGCTIYQYHIVYWLM